LYCTRANARSAGSRDSELTNHGYQQATRLGLHFKTLGLSFTHIFSSHLQRAAKTAGKIREAQLAPTGNGSDAQDVPEVEQLSVLMEHDFGSMEGKKWTDWPLKSKVSGNDQRLDNRDKEGFVAPESKDDMAYRADIFLDDHLLPLLDDSSAPATLVVAIVSHGIFLSTLWKRLLRRLPRKSVAFCLDAQATPRPSLEHLGGWSNTGYLELHMTKATVEEPESSHAADAPADCMSRTSSSPAGMPARDEDRSTAEATKVESKLPSSDSVQPSVTTPRIAHGWNTIISTVNGRDHLRGLKRTGGGVGSSRHDASQKNIESFFKRRRLQ